MGLIISYFMFIFLNVGKFYKIRNFDYLSLGCIYLFIMYVYIGIVFFKG